MNTSRSFDRAASFYDKTRHLPEPVARQGIQAILDLAGPGAHILDVGTGTGRISVPILERGAHLTGCDLSARMMAQLHRKFPSARLVQADAAHLPFPDRHFDALLTSHVMHLIGPWRAALREFQRVLEPEGVYINARTERVGDSTRERARTFWREWVDARGANWRRLGIQDQDDLYDELRVMGATWKMIEVIHFPRSYSLREWIEGIANRMHSSTWDIPDDVLSASVQELRQWAMREHLDLDQRLEEEACFTLDVARFLT